MDQWFSGRGKEDERGTGHNAKMQLHTRETRDVTV